MTNYHRFMYVSIGVFFIVASVAVVLHLVGKHAYANDASPSGIIMVDPDASQFAVIDEFGQGWYWQEIPEQCWKPYTPNLPPVPVTQIRFWRFNLLVTEQSELWVRHPVTGQWQSCGQWPGGTVPTAPETWGGVKSQYNKND